MAFEISKGVQVKNFCLKLKTRTKESKLQLNFYPKNVIKLPAVLICVIHIFLFKFEFTTK